MEYWRSFSSRIDSRCQPQYCFRLAAWLSSCVLVQQYHECWQLSFTCTTTSVQDISCGQRCGQPSNCHLFIYSSSTTIQSLPALDWQLAETVVYVCFKTICRLGLLTECWVHSYCTVCSVYMILKIDSEAWRRHHSRPPWVDQLFYFKSRFVFYCYVFSNGCLRNLHTCF